MKTRGTKFLWLALLSVLMTGTSVWAETCLNPVEIKELHSDFQWHLGGVDQPVVHFCNETDLTYKIMDGLLYLKTLQFNVDTAQELSMGVLGKNPYGYFKTRIHDIVFDGESKGCEKQILPDGSSAVFYEYVDEGSHTMHICGPASVLSKLSIAQLFSHEARHVDGKGFNHVHCEKSVLRKFDSLMCDTDLSSQGAYGVGVEFNRKFYRNLKNNPALRQLARSQALLDIIQRFNKLPLGIKEGALLQDQAGVLSFFDGQELEFVRHGDKSDLLVRDDVYPWIYNLESGLAKTIFPAARINNARFEPAQAYLKPLSADKVPFTLGQRRLNETISRKELPELLNVYHGEYICYLLTTRLLCRTEDDAFLELRFHQFKPVRLVESSAPGVLQARVAILDTDMKLHPLPQDIKTLEKISDADLPAVPWPKDVLRMDAWNDSKEALMLTVTGEIKTTPLESFKPKPVPNLAAKRFKDMLAPYFYSTKLRDL
jgi:hypothetical protein